MLITKHHAESGPRRLQNDIERYLEAVTYESCKYAAMGIRAQNDLWHDVVRQAVKNGDWVTVAVIDEVSVSDPARWTRCRLITATEILRGRLDERIS